MKKLLLITLLFLAGMAAGQSTPNSCINAQSLCNSLGLPFANATNIPGAAPGPAYGCLGSQPNPFWFIVPVSQSGSLQFIMSQITTSGTPIDVDFIMYGPFTQATGNCELLTSEKIVGCSFSTAPTETVSIANAVAGQFYLLMVTNYSNQQGFITINDNGSTAQIDCSGLTMMAFLDTNGNGVKDADEGNFSLGTFAVEANNSGTVHNYANSGGIVNIYDENPLNTYDFNFEVLPEFAGYFQVNNPGYQDVPVNSIGNLTTYYFPVTAIVSYSELRVDIIPVEQPRPGFTYKNQVVVTNLGVTPATGTLTFTNDAATQITNISEASAVGSASGFSYSFTGLMPFQNKMIEVQMQVPATVAMNDVLTNQASVTVAPDEVDIANNTFESAQTVIASYDPNDKTESHGRIIYTQDFTDTDYLYYTIRFQNSGTAAAEFVTVTDLLDDQLDENSLEVIRASHNYQMDRTGNLVSWHFADINLPAESADEPGSHGYIYFRVKPESFTAGTTIPNTANIYFDFNPVIQTNTWETEFQDALGTGNLNSEAFAVFPNPAKDRLNVEGAVTIAAIKLYDVTGKLVIEKIVKETSASLDVSLLSPGLYLAKITGISGEMVNRKVVIK